MARKDTWSDRHLNWSWLIVAYLLGFMGALVGTAIGREVGYPQLGVWFGMAIMAATTIWYLKKKKRSLWHLLWMVIPPGAFIILVLKNMNDEKPGTSIWHRDVTGWIGRLRNRPKTHTVR